MMRTFEFRAWDKRKHTYRTADTLFDSVFITPRGKVRVLEDGDIDTDDLSDMIDIETYTGIRDSSEKKKKIFEGDIVHFKSEMISGLGIVKWNEKTGAWEIDDIRPRTKKRGHRIYPFYLEVAYRVDGNVHENPELLEAKK